MSGGYQVAVADVREDAVVAGLEAERLFEQLQRLLQLLLLEELARGFVVQQREVLVDPPHPLLLLRSLQRAGVQTVEVHEHAMQKCDGVCVELLLAQHEGGHEVDLEVVLVFLRAA